MMMFMSQEVWNKTTADLFQWIVVGKVRLRRYLRANLEPLLMHPREIGDDDQPLPLLRTFGRRRHGVAVRELCEGGGEQRVG